MTEKYDYLITTAEDEKSIAIRCISDIEEWRCTIDFFSKKDGYVKVKIERTDKVHGNAYTQIMQNYNYVFFKSLVPMIFRKISDIEFTKTMKKYHQVDDIELGLKIKQQQMPDRTVGVLDTWFQHTYPNGIEQCLRKAMAYDLKNRKFCYRQ